jgi:lactoylglutathione lyase
MLLSKSSKTNKISRFMNIHVQIFVPLRKNSKRRGAIFITEPKNHGIEIHCYISNPDGYSIELGKQQVAYKISRSGKDG